MGAGKRGGEGLQNEPKTEVTGLDSEGCAVTEGHRRRRPPALPATAFRGRESSPEKTKSMSRPAMRGADLQSEANLRLRCQSKKRTQSTRM